MEVDGCRLPSALCRTSDTDPTIFTANRANMLARFQQVMKKLSTLGFDQSTLTDCSDVIPVPTGTVRDPFLPAGKSMSDIEAACSATPFPTLTADSGASSIVFRCGRE